MSDETEEKYEAIGKAWKIPTKPTVKAIIETLKTYPENFSWTPSLSITPIGKEELIRELKNGSKIGRQFIERVVHGRMMREAKKK